MDFIERLTKRANACSAVGAKTTITSDENLLNKRQ